MKSETTHDDKLYDCILCGRRRYRSEVIEYILKSGQYRCLHSAACRDARDKGPEESGPAPVENKEFQEYSSISGKATNGNIERNPEMKKFVATVLLIVGLLFSTAGVVAWNVTGDQLAAANVVVAEDAKWFAGEKVDGPLTAYAQADIIDHHALESTGGKTYAELDREDPMRAVAASAASLRTSLFASIMAFGVSALVTVLGVILFLLGLDRLRKDTVS